MVDFSDKGSSESEDMNSQTSRSPTPDRASSEAAATQQVKTCVDCGTSKTPLWRGGPAGPKSLCNACGIRSRKKRRALLGLNKDDKKTKKTAVGGNAKNNNNNNNNSKSSSGGDCTSSSADSTTKYGGEDSCSLKRKLFTFGRNVALQRPRSNTPQRRKLGEEEQAAFLLMAMSCGSVYA